MTSLWGRMDRPSGARLKAGEVYRITLARPERHNLPPVFAARFVESRPRYDLNNGHFTGWQAVFEVEAPSAAKHRSFALPYEAFAAERLDEIVNSQIWY
jgi:hypothetical protein